MFGLTISAHFEWLQMQGEGELCDGCGDRIYGQKHEMWVFIGNYIPDKAVTLCQPCKDTHEQKKANEHTGHP